MTVAGQTISDEKLDEVRQWVDRWGSPSNVRLDLLSLLTELQHRREAEADDEMSCSCGGGDLVGHASGCPEAISEAAKPNYPEIPEGWVLVPKAALDWLNGEAPDPAGMQFGEFAEDYPKPAGAFWWRTVFRQLCDFYAAQRPPLAASPSSPASGVRVKALEWVQLTSHREDGPPEPIAEWEAPCLAGIYSISDEGGEWFLSLATIMDVIPHLGRSSDPDALRAVAQSDFAGRILSALGEHP